MARTKIVFRFRFRFVLDRNRQSRHSCDRNHRRRIRIASHHKNFDSVHKNLARRLQRRNQCSRSVAIDSSSNSRVRSRKHLIGMSTVKSVGSSSKNNFPSCTEERTDNFAVRCKLCEERSTFLSRSMHAKLVVMEPVRELLVAKRDDESRLGSHRRVRPAMSLRRQLG